NQLKLTVERKNATACNSFKKSATVAVAHPVVAGCFIVLEITWPLGLIICAVCYATCFESQPKKCHDECEERMQGPKNKSGRGPPTSPTLRPRVLTPRDHFAHRGGGRRRDYAQVNYGMQLKPESFYKKSRYRSLQHF